MNTSLTAYTHLESLLLFQSLHTYGVNPQIFSSISELLKNNPHITADARFQSGRLSPDALRNFYLHKLKDEIRSVADDGSQDTPPSNGQVKSSRKRKTPSPSLPTTQEAAQHTHLIPRLVRKHYERYRFAIIEQIRDEENKYDKLQRELQSVERGEWDQKWLERASTKNNGSKSPSLPRKSPLLAQKGFPPSPRPSRTDVIVDGIVSDNAQDRDGSREGEQVAAVLERQLDFAEGQAPMGENAGTGRDTASQGTPNAQLPMADISTLALPPLNGQDEQNAKMDPESNAVSPQTAKHEKIIPNRSSFVASDIHAQNQQSAPSQYPLPGSSQSEHDAKSAPKKNIRKKKVSLDSRATSSTIQSFPGAAPSPQPTQAPLQPAGTPSAYPPPQIVSGYAPLQNIHRSPYPPQGQPAQYPPTRSPVVSQGDHYAGPHGVSQSLPQSTIPGSPHAPNQAYSPHPNSPAIPSPSHHQPQPIQPYSGSGVSSYGSLPGASPQYSPAHQHFPLPPGPQTPGAQTPIQPFQPHPGQSPYSPQQPQMGRSPHQGGIMLPPWEVSTPQDPSRVPHQPHSMHYPQLSTPVNMRQSLPSAGSSRQGLPPMHQLVTNAQRQSSFSTPSHMRTPLSAASTPRSAKSVWKSAARRVPSPQVERPVPLPIDDIVVEPAKSSQAKARAPRKSRAKAKAKELDTELESEIEMNQEKEKKKEKENDKEKDVEQEAEPDVPDQPEEPALEMETRQGRSRRKAPANRRRFGSKASSQAGGSTRTRSRSPSIISHTETMADNESQAGYPVKSEPGLSNDVIDEDTIATPSHPSIRRRGAPAPSLKRKRNLREVSLADSEDQPVTPAPQMPIELGSQTVIAPRGFAKMCNPIMNDITSHKHSSIFTSAVKAKDAEGYYEIIKRPTDLKSIQKAIAAGAKVVNATATDTPAGSPGGGGSVVELPMNPDNMPPKAIVNSSQLEKELMRMFVNAVMFNAGEEGIVEDAKQMFETVEQSVSKWKSIKQSSGRLEVEETPPVQEEELPAAAKRRKL